MDAPVFLHHPLLVDVSGRKLSKSDGDAAIRELRDAGISPAEVIGRAASLAGLVTSPRGLGASEVHELFQHGMD